MPGRRQLKKSTRRASPSPFGRLALLAVAAACAVGAVLYLRLPSEAAMAETLRAPVRETAVMRARAAEALDKGRRFQPRQKWVELEHVSPELVSAVLASEDARFFAHDGLDLLQIHAALRTDLAAGRSPRGASTLTQQVVKNLYLSEERSLLRKAEEALLAHRLEGALTKKRILTLYLNIAEWGDGVFGVEAAAEHHLGKRAQQVGLAEAAALAAMLPSPRRLAPDQRPAELHRRALRVLRRMHEEGMISRAQEAAAKVELERWLGKPAALN
ncbi:MAG: monofunctional biosynthetic peptidoglycan transglycosylase [Myxococcales bacterium]